MGSVLRIRQADARKKLAVRRMYLYAEMFRCRMETPVSKFLTLFAITIVRFLDAMKYSFLPTLILYAHRRKFRGNANSCAVVEKRMQFIGDSAVGLAQIKEGNLAAPFVGGSPISYSSPFCRCAYIPSYKRQSNTKA